MNTGAPARVFATDATDTRQDLLHGGQTEFRAYSVALQRSRTTPDAPERDRMTITDRFALSGVRGNADYGLHIRYRDKQRATDNDGDRVRSGTADEYTEIEFTKDSLTEGNSLEHREGTSYRWGLWAWSSMDAFDGMNYGGASEYAAFLGTSNGPVGQRLHAVYGLETPVDKLPTGEATYEFSSGIAEMFNSQGDVSTGTGRSFLQYDTELTFDFAENSLTGKLSMTGIRPPQETDYESFTGTGFNLAGQTRNGQWTATLTGYEEDTLTAPEGVQGLDGVTGNALGAIYGPEAEVGAGVFTASDDDRVIIGIIPGLKTSP